MTLSYTQIVETFDDGTGSPITSGTAKFTVNTTLYASGVPILQPDVPIVASIINGQLRSPSGSTLQLLDLASTSISMVGQTGFWFWTVSITVGGQALDPWSFFLEHSPDPVDLYSLANSQQSAFSNPMTESGDLIIGGAGGTPERLGSPGGTTDYLRADGTWAVPPGGGGGGSGTVTSVAVETAHGFAGTVASDTTDAQVTLSTTVSGILKGSGGSLAAAAAGTDYLAPNGSGAALTEITAAQVGAASTGALAAEVSRAEGAEALLAPLASPSLTGSPTAPTATALTDSAQVATTAYADAAVGAETSRAETAEALKAPLASPALTGNPTAPTQTTGDNSTKIATGAFVTTAVAAETARAETAEGLLIPLTQRGADSGVATLDSGGHVPTGQLPAATVTTRGAVILSPGVMPWQFYLPPIGGGTDDTANLRALIASAMAYMAASQGYAEIWLDPAVYTIAATPLKNSTNQGNSQLPLNPVGNSGPCQRLVIRSTGGGAPPNPNFAASGVQLGAGPVLLSTLTGQSNDGTWGAPSVLGGPTPQQGWGYNGGSPNFSNLMIDIEGITVMTQGPSPTMIGFDFRGLTKMSASGASLVDATVSQMSSTQPTSNWALGLCSPDVGNSDLSDIDTWTSYGYAWGLELSEHANAKRITVVYCNQGIALNAGPGQRGFHIGYLSAESNGSHVVSYGGSSAPLHIGHMDVEGTAHYGGSGYDIDDSGGTLYGQVLLSKQNGPSQIAVNGCANLEIISGQLGGRGYVSGIAFAGYGTPLLNPEWRHAWVTVSGGTVTGIKVDGQATGLTSGAVRVPSGKTLEIDGSGSAPTVQWWFD